ncbi:sensor histidine kinase [Paraflavitalea soli]|uniref:histidine kinase n=1 Tax=Paraflavitalea soli TaxID=2315862 RepID=A0A3B7MW11_9BACT|nr:HAMP domain-containing sensor histidine kinase [Paraflavitalea soli]AXY78137.1 sensor histidine kinase [Paraflavitalea soli]
MKLFTKLTLFITLSKLAIVVLFVLLLPVLVNRVASEYTNYYLREQKKKVLKAIQSNGIDYYLQGEGSYGSYTMLKEEYISLEPDTAGLWHDTIETARRLVETDTLTYRILRHVFSYDKKNYLLEVGKTTATISQYNRPLQRVALFVLIALIILTILVDLLYTRLVLRPLAVIIRTRLVNRRFPFKEHLPPIRTSTADFRYLDNALIELMGKIKEAFDKEREFTSNASHELMTPISILQNKLENLMVDSDMNEALQEKTMGMMKTLNRLKKIVHSLLLISRIENDQFTRTDTINIEQLLQEVMEELGHRAEARGITVSITLPPDGIVIPNMNHELIFQLFYNLINNAIRYNKENGQLFISAKISPLHTWTIYIQDTGIGIPAEELDTIFDRFKKANRSTGEGYGLGLSIVKSIAQYHTIRIEVSSEAGKGTVFSVVFP